MICERCATDFVCDVGGPCWCKDLSPAPLPPVYKNCLCPKCLAHFSMHFSTDFTKKAADPSGLIEGEDFYYERGLFVFTEKYHLKRGHCCDSGCKHCPY